jgi:hypothetical protein
MQLGISYAKTALGRAYLSKPPAPGSRARRSLLIMMDGRKTLQQLMPAIRSLGMRTVDVQALVDEGLLQPAQPTDHVLTDSSDLAQPPRQVVESKSLVVAKLFALDLLARILDPQDDGWISKAGSVHAPRALLRWIDDCARHLATVAGPDRAARFRTQTLAFVPDHHLKAHGPMKFTDLLPAPRSSTEDVWQHTRPFTRMPEFPRELSRGLSRERSLR